MLAESVPQKEIRAKQSTKYCCSSFGQRKFSFLWKIVDHHFPFLFCCCLLFAWHGCFTHRVKKSRTAVKRNTLAQLQRMFLPPNFAFFGRLFSDHKKVYAMAVCFALFWTISAFYQETTEEKRPFCFGQKYFKATELNQASLLGFTTFFFLAKKKLLFGLLPQVKTLHFQEYKRALQMQMSYNAPVCSTKLLRTRHVT